MPNRILATPSELGRMARKSYVKKGQRRGRAAVLQGKRTGFAAPAPSRVPVGALETKVKREAERQLTPGVNGQIIPLNTGISQGTAVYNRIGHKFRTTACRIKGHFFADVNSTRAAIVGYCWVWDKSPNGAHPLVSDIFTINAASGYDMANTLLVDDNSDRFKVLKSVRKVMSKTQGNDSTAAGAQYGTTGNGPNVVLVDDLVKLPAWCITTFKKGEAAGTVAHHQTGALYLVPFSRNLTTEGNDVIFHFTTEVFFAEG